MEFLNCKYGIVSPADTWYCRITKDICPGQASVKMQPVDKCKWGVILNPLVSEVISRLKGGEYEYPWDKSSREEVAMIKRQRENLSPEDFEEWHREEYPDAYVKYDEGAPEDYEDVLGDDIAGSSHEQK